MKVPFILSIFGAIVLAPSLPNGFRVGYYDLHVRVDPEARTVDGSVHIVGVKSPNMVQFMGTLKPGDSVEVTYTESIAVDVVPIAN